MGNLLNVSEVLSLPSSLRLSLSLSLPLPPLSPPFLTIDISGKPWGHQSTALVHVQGINQLFLSPLSSLLF